MKLKQEQTVLPVGETILTVSRRTFLKYKFSDYTFYRIISKCTEKKEPFYNIHETVFNPRWSFKPKFLGGNGFLKQFFDLSWSVLKVNEKEYATCYKSLAESKIDYMIDFTLKMETPTNDEKDEKLDPLCVEIYPKLDNKNES